MFGIVPAQLLLPEFLHTCSSNSFWFEITIESKNGSKERHSAFLQHVRLLLKRVPAEQTLKEIDTHLRLLVHTDAIRLPFTRYHVLHYLCFDYPASGNCTVLDGHAYLFRI